MKKFSFLAMASLLLGFASCSTDALNAPDEPGKVLANETQTFVKVSLVSTDGLTRAQEGEFGDDLYENGLESENKVNKLILVFFDQAEQFVGSTELTINDDEVNNSTGNADLTIARVLTTVAEVNLPENTNHPAYVVAFVNPTAASGDLTNYDNLEQLAHLLRQRTELSTDGLTMNNSVYYDEALGQPKFATPVDFTTQFFKTREEAQAAGNEAVNITVERVQAKVDFTAPDATKVSPFSTSETNAEYSLQFVPETWFVNATEKNTFLLKNYRAGSSNYYINEDDKDSRYAAFNGYLDYATLQSRFNNTVDQRENYFNEQRRLRSYWAIDPTYFFLSNDNYPEISYDVNNGRVNPTGNVYPLRYRSYNDILVTDKADLTKTYEYCTENTMNVNTLKSGRAKASMTSVVLLGHYVITDKTGKTVFDGKTSKDAFYIRHDSDKDKTVLLNDEAVIKYFLERTGNVLYVKVPAKNPDGTDSATEFEMQPLRAAHLDLNNYSVSDFKLVHPSKIDDDVTGASVISEQWRTITFADDADLSKYYIYYTSGNTYDYVPLTKTLLHEIHKAMYSAYGLVEKFQDGKAFFNVPLKHIFYNTDAYKDKNASTNAFDADNVILGDYGVVRNHVYKLTVNSIKGLGSGIGDLNQPIVPPTEVDKYYISAKLNILKWRIVNQSVDL